VQKIGEVGIHAFRLGVEVLSGGGCRVESGGRCQVGREKRPDAGLFIAAKIILPWRNARLYVFVNNKIIQDPEPDHILPGRVVEPILTFKIFYSEIGPFDPLIRVSTRIFKQLNLPHGFFQKLKKDVSGKNRLIFIKQLCNIQNAILFLPLTLL
jgi:hypothetical protein